ncbi:MAG: hypothetical protein JWO32_1651, partial [Bacteroidetes bacterium]|nr:hypothetical protein [Bacteroidota bacterium]
MKIKYFTPICILLMFLCSISASSQTKDKKWLLVDSLNYSTLSSEAKTVLDSILPNLAKHPHDSLVLKNLFYITENISENNVWSKYNDYMDQFLSNKPDTGFYLRYKGIVLVNKAYLAEHRDQNVITALELYNKSYEVLSKAGALADMATPLNNMATIYQRFGNNQKSLEYNFKAMDIFEKTNNKKGLSFSLNNIANVYTKLNNIEKAREYLIKSYKLRLQIGDKNLIAQSLNNIGGLFSSQLNSDSALPYFNRSLQIALEK